MKFYSSDHSVTAVVEFENFINEEVSVTTASDFHGYSVTSFDV